MKKKTKKFVRIRYREHTATEKTYIYLYKQFCRSCEIAMVISLNQGGIKTDGRGLRAANIFTRQVLTAHSLNKLLPVLRNGDDPDMAVWDLTTIALLSRSIMENFQALFFYGTEIISEEEADLRFHILQKDRNYKWRDIRVKAGEPVETLEEFTTGLLEQQARIVNHEFYSSLSKGQKNSLKNRSEMYYSKAEFEARCPRLANIGLSHQLLSNLAHPLPLAIERIDELKGRGTPNDADINLAIFSLNVATDCLIGSIEEMGIKFADNIGVPYRSLIQELAKYPELT
ncbi:TPA: hypothetical protein ACWW9G_002720 [Klebsiella pneumoniae]|uniref:hypothetical protein n=1 Tax=Klebsiella/Raoultella group TaxID=2890311 RepID=UPI0002CCE5E4|nr:MULTISPECIES: hypothetical protein [Klebsiella/Raoultella group]HDG7724733.1 hypothetical protein [Klebsiella quasipneumoniae]AGJ89570.1 hypothetical protein RORB6_24450 [Raoultella ornithinolytica B6]ALU54338.1 hypothetical protein AU361_12810 [Klebsiella pneumoniae]ELC9133495.1 hypothetical protein [Klebsiella pneumoniae]MBG9422424.1 hypothetical protein [Klebsiella pneumoniae]